MTDKVVFNQNWKFAVGGTRVVELMADVEYDASELDPECIAVAEKAGFTKKTRAPRKKAEDG